MSLITTQNALLELCDQLAAKRYITVDTEFLRERTFWPQLCLVQVAAPDMEAMIDPLANGIDLKPFFDLLANPNVLKVMHGCRQDIEIFYKMTEQIPTPIFDTQIAAMVCGFGDTVSYEVLIKNTIGARIDKANRFTDWSQRPLSEAQLAYAQGDVTHLRGAFEQLEQQLAENGRAAWLDEEMAKLLDPSIYKQDPADGWRRLRIQDRRPAVIGTLIEVTKWRDNEAQTRDVPRNRVLKDDCLRDLAAQRPENKKALARLRSIPRGFENSRHAAPLLEAIARGRKMTEEQMPNMPELVVNKPGIRPTVDLLKVLLKQRSEASGVAPKLIAATTDLERIAGEESPDIAIMHGWRYEIFGAYAEKLKHGRLALACEEGKVVLVERD